MSDKSRIALQRILAVTGTGGAVALLVAATNDHWIQTAQQAADAPYYLVPEAPIAAMVIGANAFAMFALWYGGFTDRRWPLWVALGTAAFVLVLCAQYGREIGELAPNGKRISGTWGLTVAAAGALAIVAASAAAAAITPPGAVAWTSPRSWSRRGRSR